MMARLLNAHSPIGKDLDSLADDVSFGVAPSLIVFSLFKEMNYPASMEFIAPYTLQHSSFSVFSALRLAKFNNDTRQQRSTLKPAKPTPSENRPSGIAASPSSFVLPASQSGSDRPRVLKR